MKKKWYHKIIIFLFENKCEFCQQIAVRIERNKTYHCTDINCMRKAHLKHSNNPFSGGNIPIDNSLGWRFNKEFNI